jgi:hypothetical protein
MARFEEIDKVSITEAEPHRKSHVVPDATQTQPLQSPLFRASNLGELADLIDQEVLSAVAQLIEDSPEEAARSNWMGL